MHECTIPDLQKVLRKVYIYIYNHIFIVFAYDITHAFSRAHTLAGAGLGVLAGAHRRRVHLCVMARKGGREARFCGCGGRA